MTAPAGTVRTVVAADTRFLLREEGEGDGVPVLLLHGVPETSTLWRAHAGPLADGRRVLAPDLPGLGGSAYPGPYDVPALVRQLAALVDQEVGGPVDVVGHDWGGSLALALAGARPELVRRLCVVNAPYREVDLLRGAAVRPRLTRGARGGDPRVAAASMLVLWGARDPVLPVRVGETVVRDLGPDAVMVTVPGAGHFVVEEAPEVVLEVLRDFLAPEPAPPYA